MEKHGQSAFMVYFVLLFLMVLNSMSMNLNIINVVYLVVVLSCSLKYILIVNKSRK